MNGPRKKILLCLPVDEKTLAAWRARFPSFEWAVAPKGRMEAPHTDAEIVVGPPKLDLIAGATNVAWVQSTSAGAEKIARSDAFHRGAFRLTTAAGAHDSCVEHAFALLLALTRQVGMYARYEGQGGTSDASAEPGPRPYDHGIWEARKKARAPRVLCGQTMGILGLGAIGRRIATIARAIGMRTVGVSYRGRPVPETDETHAIGALDELLPRFDVLVMVLPSSPETDGLMNAARLALLPRHALLVNVGRGNSVNEAALVAALREGRLAGAGLDVLDPEPPGEDCPFYALPNVVMTPHIGGNRPDYDERVLEVFLDNLARYEKGEPLRNEVERGRSY